MVRSEEALQSVLGDGRHQRRLPPDIMSSFTRVVVRTKNHVLLHDVWYHHREQTHISTAVSENRLILVCIDDHDTFRVVVVSWNSCEENQMMCVWVCAGVVGWRSQL